MTKWILGHKISPQKVTGDFDLVNGETPPHTPGPPPHLHTHFHEVFIVTEGEMEFNIDGKTSLIKKGQTVNLSPNSIHTFSNNSEKSCKWVNIHSPKGFLKFFETFGVSDTDNDAATKSIQPEIIKKVIETASDYDMIIVK